MTGELPYIPLQAHELLGFNFRSVLCLLLLFLLGFGLTLLSEKIFKPAKSGRKWMLRTGFLVCYSLLCAFGTYTLSHRHERARRLQWAERIAVNRDLEAEKNFAEIEPLLLADTGIDEVRAHLEKAFHGYRFYFTFCEKDRLLLINDYDTLNCQAFFERKAANGETTGYDRLSVIDYGIEHYAYLYRLPLSDSVILNVELGRKKISDAPSQNGFRLPASYSYAFYADGDLLSRTGDFLYSYRLPYDNITEPTFTQWMSYSNLFYPLPRNGMLIISTPQASAWEVLYNFSLFFLVFGLLGMLILLFIDRTFFGTGGTYRQRLQTGTYLILLVTFAVFAAMGFFLMRQSYKNDSIKILQTQTLSILTETESRHWEDVLSDNGNPETQRFDAGAFQADLDELSNLFRIEIYFFAPDGKRLSSTENPFIPEYLDDGILEEVYYRQRHLSITRLPFTSSSGKTLSAWVSICPMRNAYNEILGYLYIPYFTQPDRWRSEMSRFIGIYLCLTVLLSILMIVFSSLLARRITQPLQLIADKVSRIRINEKNEPLVWKRKDEIGALVKQYNLLLEELERSYRRLSETERDAAWSEMARQVAHEIKNPLTPMKLQVQQLERTYNDRKPDFEERLKRFTSMMTEQIDRLAAIAGTFSQFSQWQNANIERMHAAEFLKGMLLFYQADNRTEFVLDMPQNGEDITIDADPKFLEQIFHNLIKNALQALNEYPLQTRPQIILGVELRQKPDSPTACILYVKDNGPGIDAEKTERIFEPHFTTRSTGSGLGLAICRKLAQNMQAEITLTKNQPGARFDITFMLS